MSEPQPSAPASPGLPGRGLPARAYRDPEVFAREAEAVFRSSWQIVCHLNDLPEPGDYQTLAILGESAVVVRGEDGAVGAFHNVCRHRASRLLEAPSGHCGHRIVCPYHAWSYGLDGELAAVPKWQGFEASELQGLGLRRLDHEIWRGFVFIRFAAGAPSVAEMMAPVADEISAYRFEELQPLGRVVMRPRPVNWKTVADNYADGLHIPVAHPGLSRLFQGSYALHAHDWVDVMSGEITRDRSTNWSEGRYQDLLPAFTDLPEGLRRRWNYYRLWPNLAFDVYPDQVDFMQFIPVSPLQTLIREIPYARPDGRREARAARYLNWRINRQVNAEDTVLIEAVQAGMASSSFESGPLSRSEPCLASFAARLRTAAPEAFLEDRAPQAPALPPSGGRRSAA